MPKKKQTKKVAFSGPSDDCDCPICVFTKSQAPGEPYNLEKCPKYKASKESKSSRSRTANRK